MWFPVAPGALSFSHTEGSRRLASGSSSARDKLGKLMDTFQELCRVTRNSLLPVRRPKLTFLRMLPHT